MGAIRCDVQTAQLWIVQAQHQYKNVVLPVLKSHCRYKTVIRSFFVHNAISYASKVIFYIELGPLFLRSSSECMTYMPCAYNIIQ